MNQDNKELAQLDQCLASVQDSIKELKGYTNCDKSNPINDKMSSLADNLYASMASLRQTMWNLHDSQASKLNDHMKNHFPAPKSNKHIQNFLKACDMQDDYTTSPKELGVSSYANMSYASTIKVDKNGMKVEVDFNKPKK